MVRRTERAGLLLTLAGMAVAATSVRHTAQHVTDESYRAPGVRHGAGHVQYHMARETLVTIGAAGTLALGLAAGPKRTRAVWRGMASAVAGFAAGMWSGGPTTGSWAPNRAALAIHLVSTTALSAGVLLLRPEEQQ
ncbi:hypothetical protein GCM10022222_06590 [Amycolatopsis ultiminotia]|uniref:DUF998 domain-containing protein n=1 Tax=Amycolatopsis ultiminotia TaxID=543629 RepID=A0ABP6V357_9PSEU